MLVFAAVLWVWSDESTLAKRFTAARKLVMKMFPGQKKPGTSYQGFIKALRKRTAKLFEVILPGLRSLMRRCAGDFWTVAGWVVFGVDGSRVQTPRTKANEARFHPTKKAKEARSRARKGRARRVDQKGEPKSQAGQEKRKRPRQGASERDTRRSSRPDLRSG